MYNESSIIKDLKKKRGDLERELSKINKAILALEPMPIQYMEWKEKALGCLSSKDQYQQTTDILTCLVGSDLEYIQRKRYIVALSVALNDLCKTGVLKSFRLYRVKGDFYGFPQWFNEDGSLKKKYFSTKLLLMNKDINELLMKAA